MKKIFNLWAMAMIAVLAFSFNTVNAQTPLWSEDFSGVPTPTGDNLTQCETANSAFNQTTFGTALPQWNFDNSDKVYPSAGKVKLGTGSADGYIETQPLSLDHVGAIRVTFQAKAWNAANSSNTMLVYVNGVENVIENLPFYPGSNLEACDMDTYEIHGATAADGTVILKFQGQHRAFIDNIAIYADNAPSLGIHVTDDFNEIGTNETKTVNYTINGYNLNANESTNIALVSGANFSINIASPVANSTLMDGITVPVTFTGAAAAGTYSDGIVISNSQITDTLPLTATVIEIHNVSTIAELRTHINLSNVSANVNDDAVYRYTGHAYVTQAFSDGRKWIQDSTGAIQLYDPSNYLSNVSVEMEVTNLVGHLANYYGYAELTIHESIAANNINIFPTFAPDTLVVTFEQLQDTAFMNRFQAMLTRIDTVSFTAAGNFVKMTRYEVTRNGVADTAIYITSASDNQVDSIIPIRVCNVLGVNMLTDAYSNGSGSPRLGYSRYYILPKVFISFIDGFVPGIVENKIDNVKVFPNPTTGDINAVMPENTAVVAVYNMMGELVDAQSIVAGENTIHMSHLTSGMYYLSFINGTQILGTAKVVKK